MKLGEADAELVKVNLSPLHSALGVQWGASSCFQTPLEKHVPPFLHLLPFPSLRPAWLPIWMSSMYETLGSFVLSLEVKMWVVFICKSKPGEAYSQQDYVTRKYLPENFEALPYSSTDPSADWAHCISGVIKCADWVNNSDSLGKCMHLFIKKTLTRANLK